MCQKLRKIVVMTSSPTLLGISVMGIIPMTRWDISWMCHWTFGFHKLSGHSLIYHMICVVDIPDEWSATSGKCYVPPLVSRRPWAELCACLVSTLHIPRSLPMKAYHRSLCVQSHLSTNWGFREFYPQNALSVIKILKLINGTFSDWNHHRLR